MLSLHPELPHPHPHHSARHLRTSPTSQPRRTLHPLLRQPYEWHRRTLLPRWPRPSGLHRHPAENSSPAARFCLAPTENQTPNCRNPTWARSAPTSPTCDNPDPNSWAIPNRRVPLGSRPRIRDRFVASHHAFQWLSHDKLRTHPLVRSGDTRKVSRQRQAENSTARHRLHDPRICIPIDLPTTPIITWVLPHRDRKPRRVQQH